MICTLCGKKGWAKGLCSTHYRAAWRAQNPDANRSYARQFNAARRARRSAEERLLDNEKRKSWRKENPESVRRSRQKDYAKHRERIKRYQAAYLKSHPEKDRYWSAKWRSANPDRARQVSVCFAARRRAKILSATPLWADERKISEMYEARRFAEEVFDQPIHVDHIVPLNSPLVCGLHCEANLQLLTSSANKRKLNRYWPDMP